MTIDTAVERNIDDLQFCGLLMRTVLKVEYDKGEILKVVRMTKFYKNNKVRPLLIEFSNVYVQNVVMKNVSKLSSAKDTFEGITTAHDLTV